MENEFLNRINLFYRELIQEDRLRFDGEYYYVKNRKTQQWKIAKVLKGDIISAPTSRGTSCPLSNVRFILAHPGPYTIEMIVDLAFQGELHKCFGWIKGLWTTETRKLYFELVKESNCPIFEHYIKDAHTAFYKSIMNAYTGEQKYRQFLMDMGEDPDQVSGMKNVTTYLNEGRHIESEIVRLLKHYYAPFDYNYRKNNLIPDLYNVLEDEAIDIKRHIRNQMHKEIGKYQGNFTKVTVIYLLGSRTKDTLKSFVRKVSIFKWINEQDFFIKLDKKKQNKVLNQLELLVESINKKQAEQDRIDFHKKLVERIIELDKKGYNNPDIANQVGFTYKYVHLILSGKSLREYSGDYPDVYKSRQAANKKFKSEDIPAEVKRMTLDGIKVNEISINLNISTDMVKYHLRNQSLNEKKVLLTRNKLIVYLFKEETQHKNTKEKIEWIVSKLKNDYPHITFNAVKTFYYSEIYNKDI